MEPNPYAVLADIVGKREAVGNPLATVAEEGLAAANLHEAVLPVKCVTIVHGEHRPGVTTLRYERCPYDLSGVGMVCVSRYLDSAAVVGSALRLVPDKAIAVVNRHDCVVRCVTQVKRRHGQVTVAAAVVHRDFAILVAPALSAVGVSRWEVEARVGSPGTRTAGSDIRRFPGVVVHAGVTFVVLRVYGLRAIRANLQSHLGLARKLLDSARVKHLDTNIRGAVDRNRVN